MSSSSPHRFDRRVLLAAAGMTAAAGLLRAGAVWATAGPQSYTPVWASVEQHPPAHEWLQDAKFGIYFHWGVFSVPAFASEWYPRNMHIPGLAENSHHISVFGDPSAWPYHNFINGARDRAGNWVQFAPRLRSAGGNFDPDEWAQLFADAGAKFAGPVAEHHDGYSMWNSTVNEWNSVRTGPGLDLVRLHADAIRAKGLKFMVSLHHAYNFTGYYDRVAAQPTTSLRKLYGQLGAAAENQLWYDKLREVIDGYQPDLLWQDFNLGRDSISSSSWCYTAGIGYYSLNAMLHSLIDRVSKNGTMLLNIAPRADGTIPSGQRTILVGIGDYLRRFGESIYATRAWSAYGEGQTEMGGGSFVTPRPGTSRDIRFTRNKANTVLYATVLGWPGGTLNIATLSANRFNLSTLTSVQLLGSVAGTYINLPTRSQDGAGLHIMLPSSAPFAAPAYAVKLTFSGQIPTLGNGRIRSSTGAPAPVWTAVAMSPPARR